MPAAEECIRPPAGHTTPSTCPADGTTAPERQAQQETSSCQPAASSASWTHAGLAHPEPRTPRTAVFSVGGPLAPTPCLAAPPGGAPGGGITVAPTSFEPRSPCLAPLTAVSMGAARPCSMRLTQSSRLVGDQVIQLAPYTSPGQPPATPLNVAPPTTGGATHVEASPPCLALPPTACLALPPTAWPVAAGLTTPVAARTPSLPTAPALLGKRNRVREYPAGEGRVGTSCPACPLVLPAGRPASLPAHRPACPPTGPPARPPARPTPPPSAPVTLTAVWLSSPVAAGGGAC